MSKYYYLTFTIDDLPKLTNRINNLHWRGRQKLSKYWHQRVAYAVALWRPKAPLPKATLRCERFSSVAPDYDGLVGSFKYVIDALVVCGVLEDDSLAHIRIPEFSWQKCKPGKGYIRVTVAEGWNEKVDS